MWLPSSEGDDMAESDGIIKKEEIGIALIEEARAELRRPRPSCSESHARDRVQIGRDIRSDEVTRLWRAVLARVVEAQVRS